MRTLITCLFTLNPPNNPYHSQGKQRKQEFLDGFEALKEVCETLPNDEFSVLLIENTVKDKDEIPPEILRLWKDDWFFIPTESNVFGSKNKGAGIVENYLLLKNSGLLQDYDYIIHFEPRLTLRDASFFKKFREHPDNIFSLANKNQFFTGLFSMKTDDFCEYLSEENLQPMVDYKVSIEDHLFHFIKTKNKSLKVVDKVSCFWHDSFANVTREV